VNDETKTKAQLVNELNRLRQKIRELDAFQTECQLANEALKLSEESLARAQAIAHLGNWDWDIVNNTLWWSDEVYRIFGLKAQQFGATYEAFLQSVHPDDREQVVSAVEQALLEREPYSIEHRVVRPDGTERIVHERAEVSRNKDGEATRMVGTVLDITERKTSERALRLTQFSVDRSAESAFWIDRDARIVYVNDATCRSLEYSRDELLNMTVHDIDPDFPAEVWPDHWNELRERKTFTIESRHRTRSGRVFPVEIVLNFLEFEGKEYNFAYARDITERKHAAEELQLSLKRQADVFGATVRALALAVEKRDPYTAGHQERAARLSSAIASEMEFPEHEIAGIILAASIHDIGKIHVPAEILAKPGELTEAELSILKAHPQIGFDILEGIDFPWPVADMVLQHHERMDGSGYPQGLSGDDIILQARIIAVADVFETMSSHRPYRPAIGLDKALEEISAGKGKIYDANVVDACVRAIENGDFDFL